MILTSLLTLAVASSAAPVEFYDFLSKPDPAFEWKVVSQSDHRMDIEMTSQEWQGAPWKHTIAIVSPSQKPANKGTAILLITGGHINDGDLAEVKLASELTGFPLAVLFDIPNQPLYDFREDDLIAYTFQKYLETGDSGWPLLFPMAKSALKAMDAIEAATKTTDNPITQFVVTGASKRGWTTWFVGAAKDPRVIGIAPLVIDNLNVAAQMPHQIKMWGKYSEQIEEYTRRGLQAQLATPRGQKLAQIVDPYSYRSNISVPTLIVNGANDRYWTIDAMNLYWNNLHMPKWNRMIPNVGHSLGNMSAATEAVGAFARSCCGESPFPELTWAYAHDTKGTYSIRVDSKGQRFDRLVLWMAESDTTDFRDSTWNVVTTARPYSQDNLYYAYIDFKRPKDKNVAVFVEARYVVDKRAYSLTTNVRVYKIGEY